MTPNVAAHQVISSEALLVHWQAHRRLTRKVIEAFPEEAFFTHSIGGMRPFAAMVMELLAIAGPGIKEIATGNTVAFSEQSESGKTKDQILQLWDGTTETINTYWQQIDVAHFHKTIKSFGEHEGTVISSILYFIDNEIHHRGQAYVYLRSLNIEPPLFYGEV